MACLAGGEGGTLELIELHGVLDSPVITGYEGLPQPSVTVLWLDEQAKPSSAHYLVKGSYCVNML
jgi:hypothetical protein